MKANFFAKFSKYFWIAWEKSNLLVNLTLSSMLISLYYLNYLPFIKENTGSLISFAVGILTVEGVFLTLLVTLKSSPVMARLKGMFPKLHDFLYEKLKNQIAACIYFIFINLTISIVGPVTNPYVIFFGILVWSYLLVSITLGILYSIRTVMKIATADVDTRTPMS